MTDVFVSYSSSNEAWVRPFVDFLIQQEMTVFFAPMAMRKGELLARLLYEGINDCTAAVVIVTSAALASRWVQLEINQLLNNYAQHRIDLIIPVVFDNSRLPDLLSGFAPVYLSSNTSPQHGGQRVIKALLAPTRITHDVRQAGPRASLAKPPVAEAKTLTAGGTEFVFIRPPGLTSVMLLETPLTYQHLLVLGPIDHVDRNLKLPVSEVTRDEAIEVCRALGKKLGVPLRLPTPLEWETAYRAESRSPYFYGASESPLARYAWYGQASSQPVRRLAPNNFGFYDIAGNIWELVHENQWKHFCLAKGGSYMSEAIQCTALASLPVDPAVKSEQIGFRPALVTETLG